MEIRGKSAFVTGANRGIGREFARALVANGAKVYAAARRPETITDPDVIPVRLDVTEPDSIAKAAELAADTSILINNAGVAFRTLALTDSLDNARREMEVNYFGTWATTQAFAPVLAANGGGAVVNMLSAGSWFALEQVPGYTASKSAQWSLSNALRMALRPQGTLVVGVHCWFVDTDLAAQVEESKIKPEEVARATMEGLRADEEEVLVDEKSKQIKSALPNDLKQFYPAK
ncbi:SDR family oxidoreductase [Saccharopolyspora sp. K220]|uniref:SDR family oxidoreductase n=1 Tax=Saccharopolyspora soli TaxID=2926618 RepID=UPI001F5A5153|nr:SDR family oxidoreductase [Saccharopolyspora soli]MCI2420249.1 SDR family oxidoreductase [Saccharopolyspora soli]